jgi:hypothetical protein
MRLDTACASLSDKLTDLANRIAVLPARSWSGLAAKASTIKAAIDEETGAIEDGHCALMVVPSLVDDIARLTGGAMPAQSVGITSLLVSAPRLSRTDRFEASIKSMAFYRCSQFEAHPRAKDRGRSNAR